MKLDGLTFNEAMELLEEKIEKLEKNDDVDNTQEIYEEAVALKEYCGELLKKEKEEIIKIAKDNDIALEDIGLSEDEENTENGEEDNEGDAENKYTDVTDSKDKAVR